MDPFLEIPRHPAKRYMDLKICSAISLFGMIGIIYLQYSFTGLYDTSEIEIKEIFQEWKTQYNKSYINKDEEDFKFQIFKQNYRDIKRWNLDSDKSSKLALNDFADLNSEEFRIICCSYLPENPVNVTRSHLNTQNTHTSFNWSKSLDFSNSKINNYDSWAISIVSSIESIYAISQSKKVILSVDQLLSCIDNNIIPKVGNFSQAYNYIMEYGLMISDGSNNKLETCNYNPEQDLYTIQSYRFLPYNDQQQLLAGLSKQPIVAAIQANEFAMQFYSDGVLEASNCGEDVNQAVLITGFGYDNENKKDYWIAKNYWGKNWGKNGFVLLERGKYNTCGLLSYPSYPVI